MGYIIGVILAYFTLFLVVGVVVGSVVGLIWVLSGSGMTEAEYEKVKETWGPIDESKTIELDVVDPFPKGYDRWDREKQREYLDELDRNDRSVSKWIYSLWIVYGLISFIISRQVKN